MTEHPTGQDAESLLRSGLEMQAEALFLLAVERESCEDTEAQALMHNAWADLRFSLARFDTTTEAHYARSLELLRQVHAEPHPDVANVLNNLAALSQALGQHAQAADQAGHAVQVMRGIVARIDEGSLQVDAETALAVRRIHLQALSHLGAAQRGLAQFESAGSTFREALKVAEAAFPHQSPEVASALVQLGVLCKYTGDFAEAEAFYLRAQPLVAAAFGEGSLEEAHLLYNLGGLNHARGRAGEAEPLARRACELATSLLGAGHPDVAIKQGALAAALMELARYEEAESLNREALASLTGRLGEAHPDVALTTSNLAAVLEARGDVAEAEMLYRRAIALREVALGPEHPQVGTSLNNLAALLRDGSRWAESMTLYQRALVILERAYGTEHPHTIACREGFERLRQVMGEGRGSARARGHT